MSDVVGRPYRLDLTGGDVADVTTAKSLAHRLKGASYFIADKAYDADWLREDLQNSHITPVIPARSNRKSETSLDKRRYKDHHRIENAFCFIKDFRRVATRYDKLKVNYLAAVTIAVILCFWI